MISHTLVRIVVTIAMLVWAGLVLVQGGTLRESYLTSYELAVGVVVVALNAYDLILWRTRPLLWLGKRPLIGGTWKGSLQSTYEDAQTGQLHGPIEVYLAMHQNYSDLSVSLLTTQSSSKSLVAQFWKMPLGTIRSWPPIRTSLNSWKEKAAPSTWEHSSWKWLVAGQYE